MTETLVRVVDADQPRSADRNLVQVAVGVLMRGDHAFLLTSRPEGKAYAGYWEFPGGKLEADETVEQALRRELQEEIGITIQDCTLWKTERIDYPHALVQLNFCKVTQWTGELQMLEAQSFVWQQLPVTVMPVLPGTVPVLQWWVCRRDTQKSNLRVIFVAIKKRLS
jgi:8-oxo-dGTP diphosphatase